MSIATTILEFVLKYLPKFVENWLEARKEKKEKREKNSADRDDDWRDGDVGGVFNSPPD